MPPPELAPRLQRLPPILHRQIRSSVSNCSKGSRGLSVLPRVEGICTHTPISLSILLRQWGTRYAIRAGRNLPDKEFRYLRTVIVTAAVYWGFGLMLLACAMTSPLNLPAPGRRQTLYIIFSILQSPVFLVNSRYPLVCATPQRSEGKPLHARGSPLYRRHGSDLPSSLTRIRSIALVFST